MREVAAELERPVLLFSGGKDSIVLLRLAEKAFRPGALPVPAHARRHRPQLPRGDRVPRPPSSELGERLIVASVQESIDNGRVVEETGPRRLAQPPADDDPARRDRGARLRRRLRRRAARRGAGPRQGARLLLPRRVRPVGPQGPAARAVEPLQRPHPQGRARARVPDLQLDRARRLAVHRRGGARGAARSTSPTSARSSAATGCCYAASPFVELIDGEEPFEASVRYRTVGDMSCTGAVESTAGDARGRSSPRSPPRAITERGETRADDRVTEAAMEDRKREGYF